ncbi:DUF6157 family protein [Parapedobacter soli]|uniref:DUF6157 family protein n=1 Tax=Parapedobacter soli TaxID=416955 RepID=UPI0021C82BB4|nr:DUF6157 family protein [Parapedobacter soli]
MKTHTTNYYNTFIEVAEDTKTAAGTQPPSKAKPTVAEMQYDLIANHPYQYTSDDVLFQVYADRNGLIEAEYGQARAQFFSKGQACLRASPLTKTYGFGIHCDGEGKVALYGMETEAYQKISADPKVKKVKAMRSSR